METRDILRKRVGKNYVGYVPQSISHIELSESNLNTLTKLQRVPRKISAHFHRDKIRDVFKSDCFKDPRDNYYIIQTTDDTLFFVDY